MKENATKETVEKFINRYAEKLSWSDYIYVPPAPYYGNAPKTLDELCVFYQQLRMHSRVYQDEKDFVIERFAELIFEEAMRLADILEMPFSSLFLHHGTTRRIASTNCKGHITYNTRFLFDDADTIRETLVHELCHSKEGGHGLRFSKLMEQSMLKCGLIHRPCVYAPQLRMSNGACFPIGKHCPGYNFLKGIKGDTCYEAYLGKSSIRLPR